MGQKTVTLRTFTLWRTPDPLHTPHNGETPKERRAHGFMSMDLSPSLSLSLSIYIYLCIFSFAFQTWSGQCYKVTTCGTWLVASKHRRSFSLLYLNAGEWVGGRHPIETKGSRRNSQSLPIWGHEVRTLNSSHALP